MRFSGPKVRCKCPNCGHIVYRAKRSALFDLRCPGCEKQMEHPSKFAKARPRVVGPAKAIDETSRYCTCCTRPLKGKVAWLELDQRTNKYHDAGGVPPEQSQGWFPFGLTCASSKLAEIA